LTKTESLLTQKSSMQPSSTSDVGIISAHRLLLTQKSLMKTKSLPTHKSSTQPNSTADTEIISAHKLLLTKKSLTKTESLPTQKPSTQLFLWPTHEFISTHNHVFYVFSFITLNSSTQTNNQCTSHKDIISILCLVPLRCSSYKVPLLFPPLFFARTLLSIVL
jgi:hypothetical protein